MFHQRLQKVTAILGNFGKNATNYFDEKINGTLIAAAARRGLA